MRAKKHSTPITLGAASAAVLLGLVAGTAQAGKIVGAVGTDGSIEGWDRSNIVVHVDGAAVPGYPTGMPAEYETFESRVYAGDAYDLGGNLIDPLPAHVANVLGKDWPVGEPPGIKIVNSNDGAAPLDNGRPSNCIMTTSYLEEGYLDADVPQPTTCASGFQTHKRFKVEMLANSLVDPIDLTFDVEEDAGVERDYQVFVKINNYTGGRLEDFTVEVFNDTTGGDGVTMSLGSQEDPNNPGSFIPIWDAAAYEAANFSHGLWGPVEEPRFPEQGFFSDTRAGFDLDVTTTSISATAAGVSTNYSDVGGLGIFGKWLPYDWAPYGIFFDDDNDPSTDAQLMAFWDGTDWRKGEVDGFAALTEAEEALLLGSAAYSVGKIEDTVNLGLNFVVTVPANATAGSFTLRITPTASADLAPGYVNTPPNYLDSEGVVLIGPNPVAVGGTLALRVNDGDYFTGSTVDVVVENLSTSETETVTLTAVVEGILQGTLGTSSDEVADGGDESGLLAVAAGDVIEVTYVDLQDGAGDQTIKTATTNVANPSNGGGGCTIGSANGKGDWTLPALLAAMLGFGLMRRRRSQAFKA